MKIAAATEGKVISGHFGHCEGFAIFEVEGSDIKGQDFLENPGHKPGFLPKYLAEQKVDVIIAGGMGQGAQTLFEESNIEVVVGAEGDIESVVKSFLDGQLKSTGSVCKNHDHEDSCGEHK